MGNDFKNICFYFIIGRLWSSKSKNKTKKKKNSSTSLYFYIGKRILN